MTEITAESITVTSVRRCYRDLTVAGRARSDFHTEERAVAKKIHLPEQFPDCMPTGGLLN
jgi:hypothetical protein